jgi:ABC-2 type transport system permease protein
VSAALRAEVVKLTTVRTFLWLLLADIGFVLAVTIAGVASNNSIDSTQDARSAAQTASVGVILGLIAAILVIAGESTHGTINQTLLVTPMRERLLLVKAVIGAALALAFVLVAQALVLAILVPGESLDAGDTALVLAGTLIAAPLAGLVGVGLGAIIPGQGTAIGLTLVWLLIGEGLFPVISERAAPYTPGRAFAALVSGDRDGSAAAHLLGVAGGGAVAALWAAGLLAAGAVALHRRDI